MRRRQWWIVLAALSWGCSPDKPVAVHLTPDTAPASLSAKSLAQPSKSSAMAAETAPSLMTKACETVSDEHASGFTGLKIRLQENGSSDRVYLPLVNLEQRRDLQSKPLLISGYIGQSGMNLVCERLHAQGFTSVSFLEQTEQHAEIDSYQSLLLLENPVPKMAVFATEAEKAVLSSFGSHIQVLSSEEFVNQQRLVHEQQPPSSCRDVFLTRSLWLSMPGDIATRDMARPCQFVVMPESAAILEELVRQRTANLKRNMPLDKYKCET